MKIKNNKIFFEEDVRFAQNINLSTLQTMKIKDSVDLKELAKFGFREVDNVNKISMYIDWNNLKNSFNSSYTKDICRKNKKYDNKHNIFIEILPTREIVMQYYGRYYPTQVIYRRKSFIKDLIQANLVEE